MYRRYQNRAMLGPQTALISAMAGAIYRRPIGEASGFARHSPSACYGGRGHKAGQTRDDARQGRNDTPPRRRFAREAQMARKLRGLVALGIALGVLAVGSPAIAQKQGGILKLYIIDSPASMSIHE